MISLPQKPWDELTNRERDKNPACIQGKLAGWRNMAQIYTA